MSSPEPSWMVGAATSVRVNFALSLPEVPAKAKLVEPVTVMALAFEKYRPATSTLMPSRTVRVAATLAPRPPSASAAPSLPSTAEERM